MFGAAAYVIIVPPPTPSQLDLWYVILNGGVEIGHPDSRMETLCMGNSFGISPSLDKQYMSGVVRTKGDDCQVRYYPLIESLFFWAESQITPYSLYSIHNNTPFPIQYT